MLAGVAGVWLSLAPGLGKLGREPELFLLYYLSLFRVLSGRPRVSCRPSRGRACGFQPCVRAAFPSRPGRRRGLAPPGDSVAEASGASEATSLSRRWGRGAEKLRELEPERAPRAAPGAPAAAGEGFWGASVAPSALGLEREPLGVGSRNSLGLDGGKCEDFLSQRTSLKMRPGFGWGRKRPSDREDLVWNHPFLLWWKPGRESLCT